MLAEHGTGVEWVAARAATLTSTWGGQVLVEETGTAGFLIPALERAGAVVETASRRTFVDACAGLDAAVTSGALRHGNQPGLNDAVDVARWSSRGEAGQRVLSRRDPRVSPLVAAALAVQGLEATVPTGGWMVGL